MFLFIVEILTPSIHRETTRMRQSMDVDEGVWRYGDTEVATQPVGEHMSSMRSKLLVPNLPAYRLLNQYLSILLSDDNFLLLITNSCQQLNP